MAALRIDEAWMVSLALLWARLGALFAFSPIVSAAKVPASFVVLATLAWAGLLAAGMGLRAPLPASVAAFAWALLREITLGVLLGFALQCAWAAFAMAGRLLDVQIGFGLGTVFDPVTRSSAPVVGSALALFGMALFFAAEGHHAMLRGIAYSVSAVPPGSAWELPNASTLLMPFAAMFSAGVATVAPVLFLLLLVELALGAMSRVLPQMNVFFVGLPAKILVGAVALATIAPALGEAMQKTYADLFRFWQRVLG